MRFSSFATSRASRAVLDSSNGKSPRNRFHSGRQKRSQTLIHCQALESDSETGNNSVPDIIPSNPLDSDWKAFRAQLVAEYRSSEPQEEWAHALTSPELGCLLLAHPLMFTRQQTHFNLAVIFLFVHGKEGSAGLILNKPSNFRLGELAASKDAIEGFEENTLFLGGDVGDNSSHLVHRFGELDKATKVVDGVYINGFEAAQTAVLEGSRKPNDFNWYTRYCGWHPGQLEEECRNGVWFPAACSASLITKQRCFVNSPAEEWHQVMQLMGAEHQELSNAMLASYTTNIRSTTSSDENLE